MESGGSRTVVVGAGGVGLALGSCLYAAGHAVRFVVRGAAPHPLEREGLRREGLFGEVDAPPGAFDVAYGLADLAGTAPDFVLVCTKTTSADDVARRLGEVWPALGSEPLVVLCQNGWGIAERFAAHVAPKRVYSARVITGFVREGPTRVAVTVHAEPIHIGSLFGESEEPALPLARAIDAGGIPCATSGEIESDLLAKLLYNCLLNPIGALVGVPYRVLGERPETRGIMEAVAREIFAVLERSGRRTRWADAEAYLAAFYGELLPPTGDHESSMLQDLAAGRPTEIDALTGEVVRLGREHGVATPVCTALTTLVHQAEATNARAGSGA